MAGAVRGVCGGKRRGPGRDAPAGEKAHDRAPCAYQRDINVGRKAQVLVEVTPDVTGRVRLDGVDWNARSEQTIPAGSLCVVLSVDGATLTVRPDTATAAV
ncbi:MAG: NfeD family protein [Ruthenibacterium lactatiformans]